MPGNYLGLASTGHFILLKCITTRGYETEILEAEKSLLWIFLSSYFLIFLSLPIVSFLYKHNYVGEK